MIVRTLLTRLGFILNQGQLNGALNATNQLQISANRAAEAFRQIAYAFVGFSAIKKVIEIGDSMQSLRSRLELMPQTVGDTAEAFDQVAARANAARTSVDAYTTLYTRIGNAAEKTLKTQAEVLDVTDVVAKSLVTSGATTQEANSVMIQLSQAIGSGKLQGDELRALAESAPQLIKEIANEFGIAREDFKKAASDGKITSDKLVLALLKMKGKVDEQFATIPLTVGQATTLVGNKFKMMIDKMNRDSLFITKTASIILSVFDWIEARINQTVEYFGGWDRTLRLVLSTLTAIASVNLARLAVFLAPFLRAMLVFSAIGAVLEDIYVWINGGESLTGQWLGSFEDIKKTVEQWYEKAKPFIDEITKLAGEGFDWLKGIFDDLMKGDFETVGIKLGEALGKAILWFGEFALGVFKKIWNYTNSEGKGVFAIIGEFLWTVLSAAFDALVGFVIGIVGTIGLSIWESIKYWLGVAWDWFMGWVARCVDEVVEIGASIFGSIKKGLMFAWAFLTETLPNWASAIFKSIYDAVVKAFTDAFNAVSSFFDNLGSKIGISVDDAVYKAKNMFSPTSFNPSSVPNASRNVNSTTNVNLTVPAGTTAEQGAFIKTAAKTAFGGGNDSLARDLSVYSV